MRWQWRLTPAAERQLDRLPSELRDRIVQRLDAIAENIQDPGIKKLQGGQGFRLRIGEYRVVFQIDRRTETIIVSRIGDRKDVYR